MLLDCLILANIERNKMMGLLCCFGASASVYPRGNAFIVHIKKEA